MSDISQKQRDSLSSRVFALPKERRFPMPDANHCRLAWDMVSRAKGLNDDQRAEARRNIIKRAHELGVDTSNWEGAVHATGVTPTSFDSSLPYTSGFMTDDDGHPNRMPFAGILTWFDVPSDNAPHGADGRKVLIPAELGVPALDSLIGQAVNFVATSDWSSHNPQDKIGVITSAYAGQPDADGGVPAYIEGFIYAQDFAEAATAIKLNQHMLGFSYETSRTILRDGEFNDELVAIVDELGFFTGASILLKEKAAYTATSIAASADKEGNDVAKVEMKPEHQQAIQALKAAIKHIDSITDSIMQEYGIPDADADGVKASGDESAEDNGDGRGEDAENGMEASGAAGDLKPNGDDTTTGSEIPALHASAENTDVNVDVNVSENVDDVATEGGESVDESTEGAETGAVSTDAATAETETTLAASAEIESLRARIAELEAKNASTESALQAAADAQSAKRTSISYPSLLAAKLPNEAQDEFTTLMASIDSDEALSVEERMAKKFELRDRIRKQAVK